MSFFPIFSSLFPLGFAQNLKHITIYMILGLQFGKGGRTWRSEKDLERECVREMEKKVGARVGAGTHRVSSSQGFEEGVLG